MTSMMCQMDGAAQMAGELLLSSSLPFSSLLCSALLSMLCGRKIIHAPWIIHTVSSGPPLAMDLTCRLTPYCEYKLPSGLILHQSIQSLSRITHPRLYPPQTLQTALASTHAYKPAHTLFPSSPRCRPFPSLSHRIRLPLPALDLDRQLSLLLDCIPPPPHPKVPRPFVPLYPAQPDGNQWQSSPPQAATALRAVVLLPPGTSTEYLPTGHHYMRTPRLALFFFFFFGS
ncbi:hypothetical protein J3F84DRAFT_365976, partial [Trichoderma pleuroticola]